LIVVLRKLLALKERKKNCHKGHREKQYRPFSLWPL